MPIILYEYIYILAIKLGEIPLIIALHKRRSENANRCTIAK